MGRGPTWHDRAFIGLHYDLHANPNDPAPGSELTAEHLRERLERVKPDWVQCDCKGHAGYATYPSRLGNAVPRLHGDPLRIHRDVTRAMGIPLVMHYSGVYDSLAITKNPDWARVHDDGGRDLKTTCNTSSYTQKLMIPQLLEIIANYDVDGFWLDGENWASGPCWCQRCLRLFRKKTGVRRIPRRAEDNHWDRWLAFHREQFVQHVRLYADAVHQRNPGCTVCSNWMYSVRQPDPVAAPVDYLSGDFDHNWGSNRAAVEGRLLDGRRRSWDLMLWAFSACPAQGSRSPMPWAMKPLAQIQQEAAEVIALGGALSIYDQPQRTGWVTGWHQDRIAEVVEFARARREACFKSETRSQAAILYLSEHHYSKLDSIHCLFQAVSDTTTPPLEGALHAMLETHHSTDVLTSEAMGRLDEYALIVLPEQTRLTRAVLGALERFARAGGHVLMSGEHLTNECPRLVGARAAGKPLVYPESAVYLPVGREAVGVQGAWQPVRPANRTQALVHRLAQQEPDKDATKHVLATWRKVGRGSVMAIHGPIFRNYFISHYPAVRRFLADLLARFPIRWEVQIDAPAWVELIVRQKDGGMRINLINRGAGEALSQNRSMVEQIPPVRNITVRVRRPRALREVRLLTTGRTPRFTHEQGVTRIVLPELGIHEVIHVG